MGEWGERRNGEKWGKTEKMGTGVGDGDTSPPKKKIYILSPNPICYPINIFQYMFVIQIRFLIS